MPIAPPATRDDGAFSGQQSRELAGPRAEGDAQLDLRPAGGRARDQETDQVGGDQHEHDGHRALEHEDRRADLADERGQ